MAGASLLSVIAISACGTQASGKSSNMTAEQYAQISTGMASDQLKSIIGDPVRTEAKSMGGGHSMGDGNMSSSMDLEYWYYQGNKGWVRLEIAEGKVTAKSGY